MVLPIDTGNELGGVLVMLLDPAFIDVIVENIEDEEEEVEEAAVTGFSGSTFRITAFCTRGTDVDRLLGTFGAVEPRLAAVPLTHVC